MIIDFVGSVGLIHRAGSMAFDPAMTAVSAEAGARSLVGWAALAELKKGAAATTIVRPRAAPASRREVAEFLGERGLADMVLVCSSWGGGARGGSCGFFRESHSPPVLPLLVPLLVRTEVQAHSCSSHPERRVNFWLTKVARQPTVDA